MAIPLVPPLGSTFPTLSGLLILSIEVGQLQSSRLCCLYWLLCTWCTLVSGVDQELSVRIGQALPWTCQQEFWFDSSGGWVGCWIAEVLWAHTCFWNAPWPPPHPLYLIPPGAAYRWQWTGSALVQIMACCLFSFKSLSKPMLGYCQLRKPQIYFPWWTQHENIPNTHVSVSCG